MENKLILKINLISRFSLTFVFFYHGLVPKILWISPIEAALNIAHNLNPNIVSPIAGFFEILLALSIVLLRKTLIPIYIAVFALLVLLLDVVFMMPSLLIAAFNPVTINIVCIVLAYFVYITQIKNK
ncbi:MAG: DoxX family protein [Saccharospirillaceae bacterium]|nr:DoxX-like family protein [Pseudomonadales bacterium]NRB78038.1 DoxX family protein [Saccharospirillaceae bacterium]